jgi:hypothetical protein
VTESEGTGTASSASSGGSSGASRSAGGARKRTTTARRRKTSTRKTAASGAAAAKPRARRTTSRRRTSRRGSSKPVGLQGLLNDLALQANRAGATIVALSAEGTTAARRTIGTVAQGSRRTIARVRREWDQMDSTKRVEFVGALLAALAAAGATAAGVRKASKK